MNDKVGTAITGLSGASVIEFLQIDAPRIIEQVGQGTHILLQIAIGIATFVGIFRKRKKDKKID